MIKVSSGKANVNYSIEILDIKSEISALTLPVVEKKNILSLDLGLLDSKLTKFYGKIVNVHSFLLNNENLTNTQKLDYCSIERHFMKAYLKEMMKKV